MGQGASGVGHGCVRGGSGCVRGGFLTLSDARGHRSQVVYPMALSSPQLDTFPHIQIGRRLVIMRTFMSETGTEYTRTEVVKSQPVIDAYVRLMDHGMVQSVSTTI